MGSPVVRLKNRKALIDLFDNNTVCASVVCLNGKPGYGKYLALNDYIQNVNKREDPLLHVESIEIKDVQDLKYLLSCSLCVNNNYYRSEAPHKIFYLRGIEGFKIYDNVPNSAFTSLLKLFKDHKNYSKLDQTIYISRKNGKRTRLNLSFVFTSSNIHIQPWNALKPYCSTKGIVYVNRPDLYSVKSLFNTTDLRLLERIYNKCDGNLHQIKIYLQLEIPAKVKQELEDRLEMESREHQKYKKNMGINVRLREYKPRTIDEWLSNTNNLPPTDYDIASFFLGTAIDSPLKMRPETMDLDSKLDFTKKAGNEFASAFIWENFITKSSVISYDGKQSKSHGSVLNPTITKLESMRRCSEIVDLFSFGNMLSTTEIKIQGYSTKDTRNLYGIIYPSHLSSVSLSQDWEGITSFTSDITIVKPVYSKNTSRTETLRKANYTIDKSKSITNYFKKSADGLQYNVLKFPTNLPLKPFRKLLTGSYFTDTDIANPRHPLDTGIPTQSLGRTSMTTKNSTQKSNPVRRKPKTSTVRTISRSSLHNNSKTSNDNSGEIIQMVNVQEHKEVYLGTGLSFEHLFCISKILLKIVDCPIRSKVNRQQLYAMYKDYVSLLNTFFVSKQLSDNSIELFSIDILDTCIFDSLSTSIIRKKQIDALKSRFKCANEMLHNDGIELWSLGVDSIEDDSGNHNVYYKDNCDETMEIDTLSAGNLSVKTNSRKRIRDDTFSEPSKKRDSKTIDSLRSKTTNSSNRMESVDKKPSNNKKVTNNIKKRVLPKSNISVLEMLV